MGSSHRIGLYLLFIPVFGAAYWASSSENNKRQHVRESIVQSDNAAATVGNEFAQRIDTNHDRIISDTELRDALDRIGYRDMIGSATKFLVYDPDGQEERFSWAGSYFAKKYNYSDIFLQSDTVYIPIEAAQRFLLQSSKTP